MSAREGWIGGAAWNDQTGWQGAGFIALTNDGGQTWRRQYAGEVLVDRLQFVDAQNGWASGSVGPCRDGCQNSLLHTTNGGEHWGEVFTTSQTIEALSFTEADGWIMTTPCIGASVCDVALLRTTDNGTTWSESPFTGRFLSLSRPTANDAFVLTSDGLSATHDAGVTWQHIETPVRVGSASAFFLTTQQGWLLIGGGPAAGTQPKELFGTTDGGKTWSHVSGFHDVLGNPGQQTPDPNDGLGWGGYVGPLFFVSPDEGFVLLNRGGLYRSTDGGKSWHDPFEGDYEFYDMHMASETDGWELGRSNTLWITSDGGASWRATPLRFDF